MTNLAAEADSRKFARSFFWLLLFTLVVRVGVLLVVPGALANDPDDYRRLAENVVTHGTFGEGAQPTAYRPPLYPLLLVPGAALGPGAGTVAIGVLHVLLGVGTVVGVWQLAGRCGLARWAWLPGVLVACDPILLGQSVLVMTETAATFFVVLALLGLVRAVEVPSVARFAIAGGLLAVCGLCRPELLLWMVLCLPVLLWCAARQEPSRARKEADQRQGVVPNNGSRSLTVGVRLLAFVLMGALVLLPWTVRNWVQFGRPILTTTHGGYTLLLANNPSLYKFLRRPATWDTVWDARLLGPEWGGRARHASRADELATQRRAYGEAWQHIHEQPGDFARACLVRMGQFWALAPRRTAPTVSLAVGGWYLAEFALALAGLAAVWRGKVPSTAHFWLFGLLLAGSMTAVHAVFWSNMRMRGPVMPVVACAAAVGIGWWLGRVKSA